jgi:GT2 family glycosyltransferase
MSYLIVDIEVTQPLPTIDLRPGDTGLALLLRQHGKPLDFCMMDLSKQEQTTRVVQPASLELRIKQRAWLCLLAENAREELSPPSSIDRKLPSLTVAICTKDQPENVQRCLASLQALESQIEGQDVAVEILIVDNAPSDSRTREIAQSQRGAFEVRYTFERKPGLDFARNRAVREATGELLAFVDDDVVVDRGWLAGLMDAWACNPDAGAFTGLILPLELETEAQILFEWRGGFRRGFRTVRWHQDQYRDDPIYPRGAGIFGTGANMAFRRDVLIEIGGFDEALDTGRPLPGGGDLDIYYRILRAGYALIYEPVYLIFHQHRREMKALRRQYWSWGAGLMAYVAKHASQETSERGWKALIRWWCIDQLKRLKYSLRNPGAIPPDMVVSEIWGGVQGLANEYERSQSRVQKIRDQYAEHKK